MSESSPICCVPHAWIGLYQRTDKPFNSDRDAALVTGAGNGIGLAIAQALVGEGVRTIFADLSEEKVAAAIASSAHPELAVPWVGDLAVARDVKRCLLTRDRRLAA